MVGFVRDRLRFLVRGRTMERSCPWKWAMGDTQERRATRAGGQTQRLRAPPALRGALGIPQQPIGRVNGGRG